MCVVGVASHHNFNEREPASPLKNSFSGKKSEIRNEKQKFGTKSRKKKKTIDQNSTQNRKRGKIEEDNRKKRKRTVNWEGNRKKTKKTKKRKKEHEESKEHEERARRQLKRGLKGVFQVGALRGQRNTDRGLSGRKTDVRMSMVCRWYGMMVRCGGNIIWHGR